MNTVLVVLLILSLIVVVGILIAGFVSMAKGGDFNRKYGNKLMRARVIAQAVALVLLALLMYGQQHQQ
jgi:hypothetical protein